MPRKHYKTFASSEPLRPRKVRLPQCSTRSFEPCTTMYRGACSDSATTFQALETEIALNEPHAACSMQGTMHYSFDYAQQVHIPSNPLQPGPIYFKTPRKCGIFGVICEAIPRQVNYLIDEATIAGKGANATISYVHHFLAQHGPGETDVHFHADNCVLLVVFRVEDCFQAPSQYQVLIPNCWPYKVQSRPLFWHVEESIQS